MTITNQETQNNTPTVEVANAGVSTRENKSGILTIVCPNITDLSASSEYNSGTQIGLAIGQVLIPVANNIFSIPDAILKRINDEAQISEAMVPLEVLKMRQQIIQFKEMAVSESVAIATGNPNKAFISKSIENASIITNAFKQAMLVFCNDMVTLKKQYASQDSYFLAQAMKDDDIDIEMDLIDAPIENLKTSLNKLSAGWGAYYIVGLLTAVDEVRAMIVDEKIQKLFGASNNLAMFNRLNFRIGQDLILFHKQLMELTKQLELRMSENKTIMSKKEIISFLLLSERVKNGIEQLK